VRRIVRQARRRYWRWRIPGRPSLADPTSYLVLFRPDELTALARGGFWPLPPEALARIGEAPAERKRRRREFRLRVEAAPAEILTTRAPAVRSLLFARRNGATNGKA
jgi:hypothetical protein